VASGLTASSRSSFPPTKAWSVAAASEVQGNSLKIEIPEWLSGMLRIEEGDVVSIDNANGTRTTIQSS
jgi:hypothetical protein